jgi:hypothetical protein
LELSAQAVREHRRRGAAPRCSECKRKPIDAGSKYAVWWISRLGSLEAARDLSRQAFPSDVFDA